MPSGNSRLRRVLSIAGQVGLFAVNPIAGAGLQAGLAKRRQRERREERIKALDQREAAQKEFAEVASTKPQEILRLGTLEGIKSRFPGLLDEDVKRLFHFSKETVRRGLTRQERALFGEMEVSIPVEQVEVIDKNAFSEALLGEAEVTANAVVDAFAEARGLSDEQKLPIKNEVKARLIAERAKMAAFLFPDEDALDEDVKELYELLALFAQKNGESVEGPYSDETWNMAIRAKYPSALLSPKDELLEGLRPELKELAEIVRRGEFGALTPTHFTTADAAGVDLQKAVQEGLTGPRFVKAVNNFLTNNLEVSDFRWLREAGLIDSIIDTLETESGRTNFARLTLAGYHPLTPREKIEAADVPFVTGVDTETLLDPFNPCYKLSAEQLTNVYHAPPNVRDPETGEFRPTTVCDLNRMMPEAFDPEFFEKPEFANVSAFDKQMITSTIVLEEEVEKLGGIIEGLFPSRQSLFSKFGRKGASIPVFWKQLWNTDIYVAYASSIARMLGNTARVVGAEKGALRKDDIDRIRPSLPTRGDTLEQARKKLEEVKKMLRFMRLLAQSPVSERLRLALMTGTLDTSDVLEEYNTLRRTAGLSEAKLGETLVTSEKELLGGFDADYQEQQFGRSDALSDVWDEMFEEGFLEEDEEDE